MKITKCLRRIGLLFIVVLFIQTLYSQENYLPGYVVNLKGDTLRGTIDYKNWANNPSRIKFKLVNENNPIVYVPNDIIEFSVGNEIYVSGIITSETSQTQTNQLEQDSTLYFTEDTTFLQTIFQGRKSLYYYKNIIGKENFYIKQNGTLELLKYKKYLRKQEDMVVIAENKKYINQLAYYLIDCPAVQSELVKAQYSWHSLEKLFQHYYDYFATDIPFHKKQTKVSTEFGVMAGVSSTTLEFTGYGWDFLTDANFSKSTDCSAGAFFDIILPRNQGKWSIHNELQYSSYDVKGYYYKYTDYNDYYDITTDIGFKHLKLNNLLRFSYPIGGLKLFINAGVSNGFAFDETNYRKKDWIFISDHRVFEAKAIYLTRKFETSLLAGSGIKYNRCSLEFRYESGNGMSLSKELISRTKRYYLLLGYMF